MPLKTYYIQFGSGNPQNFAGLTPTFSLFQAPTGLTNQFGLTYAVGYTSVTAPVIFEIGVSVGIYSFGYDPLFNPLGATAPIVFTADGGGALSNADRYRCAVLDPIQSVDQRIGFLGDSYGSTLLDPTSALGYLRRSLELWEGQASFNKQTGVWTIFDRGGTLALRFRTLTNVSTTATKT